MRVLKPNRMMIVWGTLKTETSIKYKLQTSAYITKVYNGSPQNEIIWGYNWGGRTKSNFARKHDYAWCWSKGKEFLFNADDVRVERKVKKNIRTGEPYSHGTIPTCIWTKNNHTTSKDYIGWHPTTKNVDILKRMILAYTNEGDIVLDIFMGSGATAVAALRANRRYKGCEFDKEFCLRTEKRLDAVIEELEANAALLQMY